VILVRELVVSILVSLSLLLSACGGGGGGSDESASSSASQGDQQQSSDSSDSSSDSSADTDLPDPSNPQPGSQPDPSPPAQQPALAAALASGDVNDLPSDINTVYQGLIDRVDTFEQDYLARLSAIYGSASIDYPVTRSSQAVLIQDQYAANAMPLVIGDGGTVHAAFGEINSQKTAAFGTDIFTSSRVGDDLGSYSPHLVNLIKWMTGVDLNDAGASLNVKVANVSSNSSTSTYTNIATWFSEQAGSSSVTRCFGEAAVQTCMDSPPDLFIVSSDPNAPGQAEALINTALPAAKALNIPVIYTHTDGSSTTVYTNDTLEFLGYKMQEPGGVGNYWVSDADRHASWADKDDMYAVLEQTHLYLAARGLVERFKDNTFSYDLANCNDSDCDNDPRFASELETGLVSIREQFESLDETATHIFDEANSYEVEKLLALMGDRYRASFSLPMDKASADRLAWSKAFFADYTVYNSRSKNPVQADLGNFSRTDFSHVSGTNKSLSIVSKPNFRSAGVYVIPGETITVTRTDNNSSLETSIFINAQRTSSTKPFGSRTYDRPKFLSSARTLIAPGETITLTSPYGGPLYVSFDDVGINASFDVTNVGLHAFWDGSEDNASFAQAMSDNHYDWVEVASEHVEIHSRFNLIEDTFTELTADGITATAEELSRLMQTFMHGDLFALGGFIGPDIQVTSEAQALATAKGLSFTARDRVQHGVLDQPSCGYGCSGNPYDAAWDFHPLGHGDLHEIGHTIEEGKFKFDGREGHATTNPYSYYPKHRAWVEEGIEPDCQSVPFDDVNSLLQTAQGEADPDAYMAAQDLDAWDDGIALMIQVLMSAQNQGALSDGWQLYPVLHALEREFDSIDGNSTNWDAGKAAIGFGGFSHTQAASISNNDFLLVSMGHILEYDLIDYLEMYGLSFSAHAKAQVQSEGYPAMPRNYFLPASNPDFCKSLSQPLIAY
jgi:hypothetical protein